MEVKSVNEIIPHEKQDKISKNCERVQLRKKTATQKNLQKTDQIERCSLSAVLTIRVIINTVFKIHQDYSLRVQKKE